VVRFQNSLSGCGLAQRAPKYLPQTAIFVRIGGFFSVFIGPAKAPREQSLNHRLDVTGYLGDPIAWLFRESRAEFLIAGLTG
jgi:hypothetical protein